MQGFSFGEILYIMITGYSNERKKGDSYAGK